MYHGYDICFRVIAKRFCDVCLSEIDLSIAVFLNGKWYQDKEAAKSYTVFSDLLEEAKKKYDYEYKSIYLAFNEFLANENNAYKDDAEGIAKLLTEKGNETFRNDITFKALKELANRNMLASLSNYGLIPKYGFPVDVVELHFYGLMRNKGAWQQHGKFISKIKLSRDIKYAITEFAPRQEVIVNKQVVKSSSIVVPNEELKPRYYNKCEQCQTTNFFTSLNEVPSCKGCNRNLDSVKTK